MSLKFLLLSLFTLVFNVNAFPAATHVNCDLVSVRGDSPKAGVLFERQKVMGNTVRFGDNPVLAEIEPSERWWYAITINSEDFVAAGNGFLVHTAEGRLRVDSRVNEGTSVLGEECQTDSGIVFNAKPGDVIGWRPKDDNENSILTVLWSTGPNGDFKFIQFNANGVVVNTKSPTWAPSESPTETGETEAPTETGETEAPTPDDGTAGGGISGEDSVEFEDTMFRLTLAILTLFYASFVWSVVNPLGMLGINL